MVASSDIFFGLCFLPPRLCHLPPMFCLHAWGSSDLTIVLNKNLAYCCIYDFEEYHHMTSPRLPFLQKVLPVRVANQQ